MGTKNVTLGGRPDASLEIEKVTLAHASTVDPFIKQDIRDYRSTAHTTPVNNIFYTSLLIVTYFFYMKANFGILSPEMLK